MQMMAAKLPALELILKDKYKIIYKILFIQENIFCFSI